MGSSGLPHGSGSSAALDSAEVRAALRTALAPMTSSRRPQPCSPAGVGRDRQRALMGSQAVVTTRLVVRHLRSADRVAPAKGFKALPNWSFVPLRTTGMLLKTHSWRWACSRLLLNALRPCTAQRPRPGASHASLRHLKAPGLEDRGVQHKGWICCEMLDFSAGSSHSVGAPRRLSQSRPNTNTSRRRSHL